MPEQKKKPDRSDERSKYTALGVNDGSRRTDYNLYDWSGRQLDDYKEVRQKGSDR